MDQFVVLIRERQWENTKWTNYFVVEGGSNDAEQSIRESIKEYLLTDEGMKQISWTNEDFNWGDAMNDVPIEIWNKHNIKPVYEHVNLDISKFVEIVVDQDEILIPEEYFQRNENK